MPKRRWGDSRDCIRIGKEYILHEVEVLAGELLHQMHRALKGGTRWAQVVWVRTCGLEGGCGQLSIKGGGRGQGGTLPPEKNPR